MKSMIPSLYWIAVRIYCDVYASKCRSTTRNSTTSTTSAAQLRQSSNNNAVRKQQFFFVRCYQSHCCAGRCLSFQCEDHNAGALSTTVTTTSIHAFIVVAASYMYIYIYIVRAHGHYSKAPNIDSGMNFLLGDHH